MAFAGWRARTRAWPTAKARRTWTVLQTQASANPGPVLGTVASGRTAVGDRDCVAILDFVDLINDTEQMVPLAWDDNVKTRSYQGCQDCPCPECHGSGHDMLDAPHRLTLSPRGTGWFLARDVTPGGNRAREVRRQLHHQYRSSPARPIRSSYLLDRHCAALRSITDPGSVIASKGPDE